MTASTPLDLLRKLVPGDELSHKDWNAVVNAIKRELMIELGVSDDAGLAIVQQQRAKPFTIHFYTDIEIPPYAVFGIKSGQSASNPPKVNLGQAGLHLMYYTNGSETIPADSWGHGYPIGYLRPVELESHNIIDVGGTCGVRPGTFKLDRSYVGFTCLGASNRTGEFYWVIKSHDSSFVGKVTKAFPAFKPATKELGAGKVEVYMREGSDDSSGGESENPNDRRLVTTGVTEDAYTECEIGLGVGEWVKLIPVNGVGLMAHPHAMSSSSSSESAGSDSADGSEGSDDPDGSDQGSGDCVDSITAVSGVSRTGDTLFVSKVKIRFSLAKNCLIVEPAGSSSFDLCCENESISTSGNTDTSSGDVGTGSGPF